MKANRFMASQRHPCHFSPSEESSHESAMEDPSTAPMALLRMTMQVRGGAMRSLSTLLILSKKVGAAITNWRSQSPRRVGWRCNNQ